MNTVFITGVAGFIGSSLAESLFADNYEVIGIDNFTPNYNPKIKRATINFLLQRSKGNFIFYEGDINNKNTVNSIFRKHAPTVVFHLAALTGIRASLQDPERYYQVNVDGTKIMYEAAAAAKVKRFIFSSSSSVYGNSNKIPFQENQQLMPASPYAKTKYQGELLLKKLHQQNKISTTITRFFSVYGPRGRPDMAPYLFTEAALNGKSIDLFGTGETARDFTYISDVVKALKMILAKPLNFEILNIGNSHPVKLSELIEHIELFTGRKIHVRKRAIISAEARITFADLAHTQKILQWHPEVSFKDGIKKFISWYQSQQK